MPVAAGVLYPIIELLISPISASAAMTLSSVSVIITVVIVLPFIVLMFTRGPGGRGPGGPHTVPSLWWPGALGGHSSVAMPPALRKFAVGLGILDIGRGTSFVLTFPKAAVAKSA